MKGSPCQYSSQTRQKRRKQHCESTETIAQEKCINLQDWAHNVSATTETSEPACPTSNLPLDIQKGYSSQSNQVWTGDQASADPLGEHSTPRESPANDLRISRALETLSADLAQEYYSHDLVHGFGPSLRKPDWEDEVFPSDLNFAGLDEPQSERRSCAYE